MGVVYVICRCPRPHTELIGAETLFHLMLLLSHHKATYSIGCSALEGGKVD